MKYNTREDNSKGPVFMYRPYQRPIKEEHAWIHVALRIVLITLVIVAIIMYATGRAEERTCWVMCQPGNRVNLRIGPGKGYSSVGFLEIGDSFTTDGEERNGWIRVLDRGECECWIFGGYVAEEKPEAIGETRYVVAKKQLACRRWINGPQIDGRKWLKNGQEVQVFFVAGEWAVTNLGYVEAEWLEV